MERIYTEEVTDKLYMFKSISRKIDEFGWWDSESISADAGTQFTLKYFKEECQTCGFHLILSAPEHQKTNGKVKFTWRTLRTIVNSLMVHVRVLEAYINFALMYKHIILSGTTNQITNKQIWQANHVI